MSELFSVTILKKDKHLLTIKLTIINPEQKTIYSQRNFALQLLWRYADVNAKSEAPFYKKVDQAKILDKYWVFSNDHQFIDSVKIVETFNYPIPATVFKLPDEDWKAFWTKEENLPYAIMEIKVTDPKWIQHLMPGDTWKTTAVDYDHT